MAKFTLQVNGAAREVSAESDAPLLYILRNDLEQRLDAVCRIPCLIEGDDDTQVVLSATEFRSPSV